jgi:hypothetical protein
MKIRVREKRNYKVITHLNMITGKKTIKTLRKYFRTDENCLTFQMLYSHANLNEMISHLMAVNNAIKYRIHNTQTRLSQHSET